MPNLAELARRLRRDGGSANTPSSAGSATAKGAVDAEGDSQQLSKGMAELRSLLRRTATAIGAVATAVIGGLGYTQVHEIFPIPRTPPGWLSWLVLPVCVVAAVGGSAWLASRFFLAQRQILVAANLDVVEGLGERDEQIAKSVLDEHAAEESAMSLPAVELRSLRLLRIGRGTGPRAAAAKVEGDRLGEAVSIALHRAAASILEDRARQAFQNWRTALALALAAGGIAGTFAIADYYKGERALSDLRAKCAKAEADNVADACAPFESESQRKERSIATAAAAARKAVETAQAQTTPTAAQKALLERATLCGSEVSKRETLRGLDAEARGQVVALCAAAK